MDAHAIEGRVEDDADCDGTTHDGAIAAEETGQDGGRRWSNRLRKPVLASCLPEQASL